MYISLQFDETSAFTRRVTFLYPRDSRATTAPRAVRIIFNQETELTDIEYLLNMILTARGAVVARESRGYRKVTRNVSQLGFLILYII
jgi:hypothetical protein